MSRLLFAAWLALGLAGCEANGPKALPSSTVRVGEGKNLAPTARVDVFTTDEKCNALVGTDADREACKPFVDRASGTVHLAYRLTVDDNPIPIARRLESVEVYHDKRPIPTTEDDGRVQIIPHGESTAGQVYVLLIDGSGSMGIADDGPGTPTRMDKLRKALNSKEVVSAFFGGGQGYVVPLVFQGGKPTPLGGQWLVTDSSTYRALVRDALQVGSGYTFLYQAVDYAVKDLALVPELKQVLTSHGTTIIALTDGFNNESHADTCGDNAPRLEKLVATLGDVRRGKGIARYQPEVFTVGLGRKAWPRFKLPNKWERVDATRLCPNGWDASAIDGGAETNGVDNATLAWIAAAGAGKSFVKRDADGLAAAFVAAAEKRYDWFELNYRRDPFYLRRAFTTRIHLLAPFEADVEVPVSPNAWIDGPPGEIGPDGWPRRPGFRASVVVLVATLSLLIVWNYLPAAVFNVRRALFGLVDGGRRAGKTG